MKIKKNIFNIFRKTGKIVGGKGLGKLPFAMKIYQFFYRNLKPSGIVEIKTKDGNKMLVDSCDTGMAPYLIMHGKFADDETDILKKILKHGMVFADIGANIGYFSLIAASLIGEHGKVFAFEPDDNNFSLLEKNINKNNYKNITAIKKAVSDKKGKAKLYLDNDNLCAHSLTPKNTDNFLEVETISLNEYFKGRKIDVIKIDVEGFEQAVLDGMKEIIKANNKITVITEFYPKGIERAGYSPLKYLNNLSDLGFILNRINKKGNITQINPEEFLSLSKGKNIGKLINILCSRK